MVSVAGWSEGFRSVRFAMVEKGRMFGAGEGERGSGIVLVLLLVLVGHGFAVRGIGSGVRDGSSFPTFPSWSSALPTSPSPFHSPSCLFRFRFLSSLPSFLSSSAPKTRGRHHGPP